MKIPNTEQKELLLNSWSTKAFAAVVSACWAEDPSELHLKELLKKLDATFPVYFHQITEVEFLELKQENGERLVEVANQIWDKRVALWVSVECIG